MKISRSVGMNAVRLGMGLALLWASATWAADASAPPEVPGPAERGINPDTTLITIKDMLVNQKMDLMFEVPLVQPIKVADNLSIQLSTHYNSNILSWLDNNLTSSGKIAFIPTYHSPLGVGFEPPGSSVIFQNHHGDPGNYRRDWVIQTPDGNVHALYVTVGNLDFPPYPPPQALNTHLIYGNTFLTDYGTPDVWRELYHNAINLNTFEYHTADDSLIRARLTLDGSGLPASWEILFPDGRRAIYDHRNAPVGKTAEDFYYNPGCCVPASRPCPIHIDQADPQNIVGFFPSRIENRMGTAIHISYDSQFPYLMNRISDDTSRTNGDIIFSIDSTGHYQSISYPAASGNRVSITFDYITQNVQLRTRDGSAMMNMDFGITSTVPEPLKSVTLLSAIHWPGGYTQSFTYYNESATGTNYLGSARISSITLPTGASHLFTYMLFPFQEYSFTPIGSNASVGISSRVTKLFPGALPGSPDFMQWSYAQQPFPPDGYLLDVLNIVTDPAGNDTTYYFYNAPYSGPLLGLLGAVTYYEGAYSASKTPKRYATKRWVNHQDVGTTTFFYDDLKSDNTPNDLSTQNLGPDGWGHFTTKRTSGSVIPVARQVVTIHTVNSDKISYRRDGSLGPGYSATHDWAESCTAQPIGGGFLGSGVANAYPQIDNCGYLSGLLDNWFPSLPASEEVQENIGGTWVTRSRTETQYDPVRGLPVRSVKRYDPGAAADNLCTMNLTPRATTDPGGVTHRDSVTDFYYDSRGNLALKLNSGGEDNSVFRAYMGTGDKPADGQAPSVTPSVGFPGSGELIYPNSGTYFGFGRWSREFSPGEGADHQFVDSSIGAGAPDVEPASGAILKTSDANGLSTTRQYDDTSRRIQQQFLGDGAAPDRPINFKYINVGGRQVGSQSLQFVPGDESQTSLTQDYLDAWGRKIISRRRNPGGGFSFQATHYDAMGKADYISFWSFAVPPGIGGENCTSAQLLDSSTVCPSLDPGQWSSANLLTYITVTAGSYTRNCYRVSPSGTNNYRCDDSADYEFQQRVRRVEKIGKNSGLLGATDTVYFGLNSRVITHLRTDGTGDPQDRVTDYYKDGFGNLRIVDADAGATTNPQGADAIYDYDYVNHLVKANLVPQVTFPNPSNLSNRLATANGDYQTRVYAYDPLGRQTSSLQPESGLSKYLKYNALDKIVEMEDENGRIGGGPGGGVFQTRLAPPPGACTFDFPTRTWFCPAPTVIINGAFETNGELNAQWNGRGIRHVTGVGNVAVPASGLYYMVTLDSTSGQVLMDWILGQQTLRMTGIPTGTHQLWVQVSYGPFLDPDATPANFTFTDNANPAAYHLLHLYDSRGRETAVQKKTLSPPATTTLRQFNYETQGQSCTPNRSCGKMTQSIAMRAGTSNISTSFDFLHFDATTLRHDGRLARQFSGIASSIAAQPFETRFDYDGFGRSLRAFYPTRQGPASPDAVQLGFQFGGVKSFSLRSGATLTPYATMDKPGDFFANQSLAGFRQGNGLDYNREQDEAERGTRDITYSKPPCPAAPVSSAVAPPPCTGPTLPIWESGLYSYDGADNITAIGGDQYSYDRINRLTSALQNRHPRALDLTHIQPPGTVNLSYAYDPFGNITQRTENNPAGNPYTVKIAPTVDFKELFTNRSYTNGVVAPDNRIHDTGFLYDANGNLVTDGKKDYVYDELNQQFEVHEALASCIASTGQGSGSANIQQIQSTDGGNIPAAVACYGTGTLIERNGYDATGLRASRDIQIASGSIVTRRNIYVRTGSSVIKEFTEETTANGACTAPLPKTSNDKSYIYGPVGLLATEGLCTCNCTNGDVANQPTTRYYELDHLGTIRAITNSSGALETTFDYEPFGLELRSNSAASSWWADVSSNTHRFTGHEREFDGGGFAFADYMKARMYALNAARFDQIDPVFAGTQDVQNWCAESYVKNMPVNWWDPEGKDPVLCTADMTTEQCLAASSGSSSGSSGADCGECENNHNNATTDCDWQNFTLLAGAVGCIAVCESTPVTILGGVACVACWGAVFGGEHTVEACYQKAESDYQSCKAKNHC